MENHILSGNNGTLEYKTSLAPISPGRYSPIPKHMLVEDDYTRSDASLYLLLFMTTTEDTVCLRWTVCVVFVTHDQGRMNWNSYGCEDN